MAAFVNVEHAFNERWRLSGGLRWTEDEKQSRQSGFFPGVPEVGNVLGVPVTAHWDRGARGPRTWDATIGHISVEYTPRDNLLTYGRISTGFRAGGFQLPDAGDLDPVVKEESVVNHELGLKGLFLDKRLQLMAAAYFNDYEDFHFVGFQPLPPGQEHLSVFAQLGCGACPPLQEFTKNVEGTNIWGAEMEWTYYLDDRWRLSGFYNYLDSEIGSHEFVAFGDPDAASTVYELCFGPDFCFELPLPDSRDVTGNRLPRQPKHKGALMLAYTLPLAERGSLQLLTTWSHIGERFPSIANINRTKIPSYSRWDVRAAWRSSDDRWGVTAYVQNVLDDIGVRSIFHISSPAMARLTDPRRFGLQVSWRPQL